MNFWFLFQVVLNIVLFVGFAALWIRISRPAKDDPRLSKGLQLLQSKIAVLEDLSDRTEIQVQQLTALLESKVKEIQNQIQASEKQLQKIDQSMAKSKELANLFQDRIPHEEILERQNTKKFVKAARMAHQGQSVEEIIKATGLNQGEVEFIAKVNKDQLQFCEESLPEWIDEDFSSSPVDEHLSFDETQMLSPTQKGIPRDLSAVFEVPQQDQTALKKLGEAFKAACKEVPDVSLEEVREKQEGFLDLSQILKSNSADKVKNPTGTPQSMGQRKETIQNLGVRPVEFRRIESTR